VLDRRLVAQIGKRGLVGTKRKRARSTLGGADEASYDGAAVDERLDDLATERPGRTTDEEWPWTVRNGHTLLLGP
jgi:hypothetical protein